MNNATHMFLRGTSFKCILTHEKWETSVTFSDVRIKKVIYVYFLHRTFKGSESVYSLLLPRPILFHKSNGQNINDKLLCNVIFSFNSTMLVVD